MKKAILSEVIAALLVLLFLYAAFSKLADFPAFRAAMAKQPFPKWAQAVLVFALPAAEIVTALLLVPARTRLEGLCAFCGMMGLFTGYTAAVLLHWSPWVPCTCGGLISRLSWGQHLVFNLFFLSLGLLGIRLTIFHARNQDPTARPVKTGRLFKF
jgi:hypothetical protein